MAVAPVSPIAAPIPPAASPETHSGGGFAAFLGRAFDALTFGAGNLSTAKPATPQTQPASSTIDPQTRLDQLLSNLHRLIRDRLTRRGIDPQQPFQLSVDRRARVEIEGDHFNRDRVADIFQDDPELTSILGEIVALNSAARAGSGIIDRILPTQLSYTPGGVTLLAAQDL